MKTNFKKSVIRTAEDIWVNYYQLFDNESYSDIGAKKIAKECAIIAVNEIFKSGLFMFIEDEQYWNEVKQEIEKL